MHKLFAGHKKMILLVLIVIVLGGGAMAGLWYWKDQSATNAPDTDTAEFASTEVIDVLQQAGKLSAEGKNQEAIDLIDQFLASENINKWEKSDALTAKAAYVFAIESAKQNAVISEAIKDALAVNQQAIDLVPEDPNPYEYAGKLYLGLQMKEEAKPWFEKALAAYDAGPPEERKDLGRDYYLSFVELAEGKKQNGFPNIYYQ